MLIELKEEAPELIPAWCDLFHDPRFYKLNQGPPSVYYSLYKEGRLVGLIHFTEIEKGHYRSPYKGTFGSFNFDPDTDLNDTHECVLLVTNALAAKGLTRIEVVSAPFAHDHSRSAVLFNAFLQAGYLVSNHEINHCLSVNEQPFIERVMRNNKKRLKKCEREGFQFLQVFEQAEIEEVYQTIKVNRESKGYEVSMRFEQIMDLYREFPDRLFFFMSRKDGICACSSICIRISTEVLYVFYWGDVPGYEQYSPVSHLAGGIYEFARQTGCRLIDAGTSSLKGQPNFGVARFKENLGFTASSKPTFVKQL